MRRVAFAAATTAAAASIACAASKTATNGDDGTASFLSVRTLVTLVLCVPVARILFRVLNWYRIERFDPWFWNGYGLGAPQTHRLVHFILKACALVVVSIPSPVRVRVLGFVKRLKVLPKMSEGTLDFDFDGYNALIQAPTIGAGAKALGMKHLCEWLYRPRHYSIMHTKYTHPLMRPILFIPGLECLPFTPASALPEWAAKLEAATPIIAQEFMALTERSPKAVATYLVPEDMKSKVQGWRTFFFVNPQGKRMDANCALCPRTWDILMSIPGFIPENMTMFSVLSPGAEIQSHCGLTNAAVRVHLPLVVPEPTKSVIRVGPKVRTWEQGKLLVFNDGYDHQVWNFGRLTRVVLFFDIWHPGLTSDDLAHVKLTWRNIKASMGSVADEYERMSRKEAESEPENSDAWLKTQANT